VWRTALPDDDQRVARGLADDHSAHLPNYDRRPAINIPFDYDEFDIGRTHYFGDGCDDDHGRIIVLNVDEFPTLDVTGHHHVVVRIADHPPFVIVNNDYTPRSADHDDGSREYHDDPAEAVQHDHGPASAQASADTSAGRASAH
jgi:hypothetical protein